MTVAEREAAENKLALQLKRFPASRDDMLKRYESRISNHLLQEIQEVEFGDDAIDDQTCGNERIFGSKKEIIPPFPGAAWLIEAPFVIHSCAQHGRIVEKRVTLRAWSDQSLARSIDLNVKMVQMQMEGKIKRDIALEITTVTVIMWLRLRGQFFWLKHEGVDTKDSKESMYFDGVSMQLKSVMSDDFRTWLHAHSGISPANERAWKQIIEGIKTASTNPDIAKGVIPGNLFDRRGDVLYISCGPSWMVRVDKDGVRKVANGTDGVVFALGKTLGEWELLDENDGKNPFKETQVFGNANYTNEYGRIILMLWFLSLAACIRNYPIILFQGRFRSGKTRCAQAIFELLGVKVSMNSVQDNGEDDFWALLDGGGMVCWDNVDGRIVKWFPNDIQIASTGGSKTKRKMYTDADTVSLAARAKIVLTANDPRFMCDSGISDRVLNIELGPFTSAVKKDSEDSKLTEEIVAIRSAAFTWMAYTLSHALADNGEVRKNINKRHPDFARFALRVSRALGIEADATSALIYAEFNKSYQTLLTDRITQMIYEVVRTKLVELASSNMDDAKYEFTASEMLAAIKSRFGEEVDENDKQLTNRVVGKVLSKHLAEFGVMFTLNPPRTLKGITRYTFTGFTDAYRNMSAKIEKDADNDDDIDVEKKYREVLDAVPNL